MSVASTYPPLISLTLNSKSISSSDYFSKCNKGRSDEPRPTFCFNLVFWKWLSGGKKSKALSRPFFFFLSLFFFPFLPFLFIYFRHSFPLGGNYLVTHRQPSKLGCCRPVRPASPFSSFVCLSDLLMFFSQE